MISVAFLLLVVSCLTITQPVKSDPVPQRQEPDACADRVIEAGREFKACVGNLTRPDEAAAVFNESMCPNCAYICSKLPTLLECSNAYFNISAPCSKFRSIGASFLNAAMESTLTFLCQNDGNMLYTFDDEENTKCIGRNGGECPPFNKQSTSESSSESKSDESEEQFTEEQSCRLAIESIGCIAKSAAACTEESAYVLNAVRDNWKATTCSRFYNEV